jgi:hypothetical protein
MPDYVPPEIPSERHINAALELIKPAPECREQCRHEVRLALEHVNFCRTFIDNRSLATRKKEYAKLARALREVETAARGQAVPEPFLQDVRHYREEYGQEANEIVARRCDTRKPDKLKREAAERARKLLVDFDKRASRTRNGLWHKLANILYDRDGGADLFEYLGKRPK